MPKIVLARLVALMAASCGSGGGEVISESTDPPETTATALPALLEARWSRVSDARWSTSHVLWIANSKRRSPTMNKTGVSQLVGGGNEG